MPHTDEEYAEMEKRLADSDYTVRHFRKMLDQAIELAGKSSSFSWLDSGIAYLLANHKVDAVGLLTAGTALYFALFPQPKPDVPPAPAAQVDQKSFELGVKSLAKVLDDRDKAVGKKVEDKK